MTAIARDLAQHADGCRSVHSLPGCDCFRVVYNDGVVCVTIGPHFVSIGSAATGQCINVPNGHAYYDRTCEATDFRSAHDLFNELSAALA